MGYQTPNIDRIAKEGARFTDFYGQQSCTAGRAAFITMRGPKFFDLRADPFERGEDGLGYSKWMIEQVPFLYFVQARLAKWLSSFKEFPPRARAASFSIDQVVEKMMPKS